MRLDDRVSRILYISPALRHPVRIRSIGLPARSFHPGKPDAPLRRGSDRAGPGVMLHRSKKILRIQGSLALTPA
jgi:hypothetical protein